MATSAQHNRPSASISRSHGELTPLVDNSLSIAETSVDEENGSVLHSHTNTKRQALLNLRESLVYDELRGLTALAVPVVGTYLLEFIPGLISIVLVGHVHHEKTKEYIDATAMAVVFMNLTGLSIGVGLSTAMDTLCSQAYGAGETQKMGTYFQTGIIILATFCIVIGCTFYYATPILIALGQPEEVSELAGMAVWALLPGVPFLFVYELLRKVLQAQNIAAPMFYASVGANVANAVAGYYLVFHTSCGWIGASYARTICNVAFFLLLFPYVLLSGHGDFWTGLHLKEAVEGIPTFLSLGIPGMLQLCFEWWAFEVLALICGLLPNAVVSIGANAVIMNVSALVYMFYLGLSISGNVRIGNALGAGDDRRARLAALTTIGLCAGMAVLCAAFLLIFRESLPKLFTHDETINEVSTLLIMVAAIFQIPDSINAAVQGCFRGSGRQNLGAQLNFVAYYFLGIPFGCILAFSFHLGVVGLWTGMVLGLTFIALCGTILIVKSDWEKLSNDAKNRVGKNKSWNDLLDAS